MGTATICLRELVRRIGNEREEWDSYLDTETGGIVDAAMGAVYGRTHVWHGGDAAERWREMETSGRYIYIPPVGSGQVREWMSEFVEGLPDSPLRNELAQALRRGSPLRYVLARLGDLRADWERLRHEKLVQHARRWVESRGLDVSLE